MIMSILYINRNGVCFCNDNLSKIYYYEDKGFIEYNKLKNYISTIGKRGKLFVVIGSFYTNIDFIQKKNDKINFLDFLQLKLEINDVVCGNISVLNKDKTEAVVTTIKSNAQEHHIVKIMEMLQQYNIDLQYIYCLEQIPLLYGLLQGIDPNNKNYVPELNIIVILLEEKFFLSVANGKDFILGREIMLEPQGDMLASIANTLSMVIKNIELTYINIHSKSKVKIFSFTTDIDIEGLKNQDSILQGVDITFNKLNVDNLKIDNVHHEVLNEMLLIKTVLPKLKYLQPLTSGIIKKHKQMFNIIRYIKIAFFLFCVGVFIFFVYCLVSFLVLEAEKRIKNSNVAKETKKLRKYQEDNSKITKNVVDVAVMKMQQLKLKDEYDEPLKIIAKITNENKAFLDVQSYQFDCVNTTKQDKIFFVSFEVEMFNRAKSYTYAQTNINKLVTDISEELKKQYKKVAVFDEKMPKLGIKELAVEDFFDTIFVVCTNNINYKLPSNDKEFNEFLSKGKTSL